MGGLWRALALGSAALSGERRQTKKLCRENIDLWFVLLKRTNMRSVGELARKLRRLGHTSLVFDQTAEGLASTSSATSPEIRSRVSWRWMKLGQPLLAITWIMSQRHRSLLRRLSRGAQQEQSEQRANRCDAKARCG